MISCILAGLVSRASSSPPESPFSYDKFAVTPAGLCVGFSRINLACSVLANPNNYFSEEEDLGYKTI